MEQAVETAHQLIRLPQVCDLFGGVHKNTVYNRLRKDPKFPRPLQISSNSVAWRLSEIQAYIDSLPRAGSAAAALADAARHVSTSGNTAAAAAGKAVRAAAKRRLRKASRRRA